MTKARTRIWSILLVTVLLLSMLPATALAASYANCADGDSCTPARGGDWNYTL